MKVYVPLFYYSDGGFSMPEGVFTSEAAAWKHLTDNYGESWRRDPALSIEEYELDG